ncbi:MAG: GTPase Era [Mycobacteriales bacterium]
MPSDRPYRSGFACLVGRPNTGKSTLTNALVGAKVAITSGRPQTTRHAVRGVLHRPDGQLVLVDTPGFHRPRTLLGQRLNDVVLTTLGAVDAVVLCVPADQKVGPGDRFIAGKIAGLGRTPLVAVVTKSDAAGRRDVAERLVEVADLADFAEIVPVSALAGEQVGLLSDLLLGLLPEGPALYPDGELTDEPEQVMVAELVREAALEGVRDELPHSLAVLVEEMVPRPGHPRGLVDVRVEIYVERPTQKAIVIGHGGGRLKDVGSRARREIEALLGTPVYLDLHVRVAPDWQRDPKQLRKLGF